MCEDCCDRQCLKFGGNQYVTDSRSSRDARKLSTRRSPAQHTTVQRLEDEVPTAVGLGRGASRQGAKSYRKTRDSSSGVTKDRTQQTFPRC